jgi:hypothetical protein
VVPRLNKKSERYEKPKKRRAPLLAFFNRKATHHIGTHATKTKGVRLPEKGKASMSRIPDTMERNMECCIMCFMG